ncbi:hypothetical protein [Actinomyces oris]|uniref:hypothetical protein n=1 Tax=Actinomyces oris TaxID=544580 RepID=UPI0028E3EEF2|nr:hypothetical protein [Actinomyces oris]
MPIRRFAFTRQAGGLYPEPDLAVFLDHTRAFLAQSGLSLTDVVASPVASVPVPDYQASPGIGSSRRRPWPVRAEFMWHPLMWLPDRLRSRAKVVMPGGGSSIESDEQWAIRVLTEMQASGPFQAVGRRWVGLADYRGVPLVEYRLGADGRRVVPELTYDMTAAHRLRGYTPGDAGLLAPYDPADGTWLDVPYLVGVDLTSRQGVERMDRWLAGAPDADLDGLDLDVCMRAEGREEMWAFEELYRLFDRSLVDPDAQATAYVDDVIAAGWFLAGRSAFDAVMDIGQVLQTGGEPAEVGRAVAGLVGILADRLPGLGAGWDLGDRLAAVLRALDRPVDADRLDGLIRDVADCAFAVALAFEPDYERLITRDELARRDLAIELVHRHGVPLKRVEEELAA